MKLRSLHPSYLNRIDLVSTATGDPGVSFELTPFLHLYKNMHFTKDADLSLIEEDENDAMKIPNTMIDEYFDDSYEKDDFE